MPGHRRRIRLRQDDDRAVDHAPAARRRPHHRRADHRRRHEHHRAAGGQDAGRPREPGRDGIPGPADLAQPDEDHRRPDRRVGPAAPRRGQADRAGPRGGGARAGRHAPSRRAGSQLPAPAVRRHAAAGDDRHGAGLRAQAADRRRAHHRAGRHDTKADPGADRRPARPAGDGGHPGHPRPGRHRRPRRPGRGHVRRAGRGNRGHHGAVRRPAPPVHRGAVRGAAGNRGPGGPPAVQHPGPAAGPDRSAARLQVRPALPLRPGHLPRRRAGPDRQHHRAPVPLLFPGRRASPRAGGRTQPRRGGRHRHPIRSRRRGGSRLRRYRRPGAIRTAAARSPGQGLPRHRRGAAAAADRDGIGGGGRLVHDVGRADLRPGRRVRLRQDYYRTADRRPGASHRRPSPVRRRGPDPAVRAGASPPQARHPANVPGLLCLHGPPDAGWHHLARAARHPA